MVIKIKDMTEKEFDNTVVNIDAWYDRHTRDYVIQLKNADGYQVGDAIRVGDKNTKNSIVKELKAEYNL